MSLEEWKINSRRRQDGFGSSLGDRVWELYKLPQERQQLWQKIATALFGHPKQNTDDFGLSDEEKERVNGIRNKCIVYSRKRFDDVYIAIIFACVYRQDMVDTIVPVIRVRWDKGESHKVHNSYFIDHLGRVYNTWENYLKENIWEVCWICVPDGGIYLGGEHDDARFYDQTLRGDVAEVLDKGSAILGISSSVGLVAGIGMTLFPPTAALGALTLLSSTVAGAPGAVYGLGRSIGKIMDRLQHDQSLELGDAEARMCWLNVVASIVSLAGMGATKALSYAGKMGIKVSAELGMVCTGLGVASISTSGLNVLNYALELEKKEEITPLDALQFTTSVFFLTHSVVTFKTASTIIRESQDGYTNKIKTSKISGHSGVKDGLPKTMKGTSETAKIRATHSNTQFIKEIKKINSPLEFFNAFHVIPDDQPSIKQEPRVSCATFGQMTQEDRNKILDLSAQLGRKEITLDNFNRDVKGLCNDFHIPFENHRAIAIENINKALHVESFETITVNGEKIFENMKSHELNRLIQVLESSCKNYDETCIGFGMAFSKWQRCKNVSEFCAAVEYAARKMDELVAEMKHTTPIGDIPQNVKPETHLREKVFKEFMEKQEKFHLLSEAFEQLRARCSEANVAYFKEKVFRELVTQHKDRQSVSFDQFRGRCFARNGASNSSFGNSLEGGDQCDTHSPFPTTDSTNNFSPLRYLDIAREMSSATIVEPQWTRQGSRLNCEFHDHGPGDVCVIFDDLADGSTVIGTLTVKDLPPISRIYNR